MLEVWIAFWVVVTVMFTAGCIFRGDRGGAAADHGTDQELGHGTLNRPVAAHKD